mgnify:FL=1
MTAPNKRLLGIIAAIPFLLLIPLVAMQFTTEVDWDAFDFAVMGALLLLTGFGIELALRIIKEWKHRLIAVGIILLLFILVWGELATGFFRTNLQGTVSVETSLLLPSLLQQ